MASHLDLEEQEQIDELKHFWKKWGGLISTMVLVVLVVFTALNGYQYWQRTQASQAAVLLDAVTEAMQPLGDVARLKQAAVDLRSKYSGTAQAVQGNLLAAKFLTESGETAAAKEALIWVAEKSGDDGAQAVARLRLTALHLDAQAFDDAWKLLNAPFPSTFVALVQERKGDALFLQGKTSEAATAYKQALASMDASIEYRRLLEVKAEALGVSPLER